MWYLRKKGEELETLPEDKEKVKLEAKDPIASPEAIEKSVFEVDEGDSDDFGIQEFLEEHGDLPSEKDLESEK